MVLQQSDFYSGINNTIKNQVAVLLIEFVNIEFEPLDVKVKPRVTIDDLCSAGGGNANSSISVTSLVR